jgi:DNA-binding CsgD family transcriptional regulator
MVHSSIRQHIVFSEKAILASSRKNFELVEFLMTKHMALDLKVVKTSDQILAIKSFENIHKNSSAIGNSSILQKIIDHSDSLIFWKDEKFIYQGCNLAFANIAGFTRPSEVIGKTDYELGWDKTTADIYRQGDVAVLSNAQIINNVEPVKKISKNHQTVTGNKYLLRESTELVAIMGIYEIVQPALTPTSIDDILKLIGNYQNILTLWRENLLDTQSIIVTELSNRKIKLSKREAECALLLVSGKSAKQIADELSRSKRTVEVFLNNLKTKFNCYSKSELISKLFKSDLLYCFLSNHSQ